jgi:hypothetical protein
MKQLKFFVIVLVVALLASCNKDNQPTGVGDALIVAKKSGSNTVYGLSLYAYTFSSFQSVKAVSSADAGNTYTLQSYPGYASNYYYETPDADYSTTKPAASIYTFTAVFSDGSTQDFQDELSDLALLPPNIEKCAYDVTAGVLEVTWTPVTDADSYSVKILDGTTQVFGSPELSSIIKTYTISASGNGWATGFTPVNGKTYTVKTFAYLYEPQGNAYNVQALSVTDTSVLWGNE